MPNRIPEAVVTIGLAGAFVAQMAPNVPDTYALMAAAALGSAVTSGWRVSAGLILNWLSGAMYWFTGAVGAYFGGDLAFKIWSTSIDSDLHVPLMFFGALFAAAIIKALATAAKFDGVVKAFQEGLAERVKKMAAGK